MAETVNLKFKVFSGDASKKLKDIGNNLKNMSGKAKKTTSSMGSFYNSIRKVNNRMGNLNKDLNRASNGFTKLTSRMSALSSVFNLGTLAVYKLANALVSSVNGALDMIETLNLFEVSLGDMAVATDEFVQNLSEIFGLDVTNLRNAVGTYALLARSMGMNTQQASLLSKNITQLAIDYSSLTNVPIEQVMGDLKSGLVGQSETVYKYGLDVTEAGIKAEAMAEGISKSVRNMSQGEKMALRYNAMIRQSILAHGDFARTIETPANQIRVLTEKFTTLSRTIGTIFIPILSFVLPYLNAVANVMIKIAQAIATFVGYKADDVSNGISSGLDGVTDSSEEATDGINALKKSIMGFDEFNILQSTSSSGGSASGGSILDDIKLAEYNMITTAVNQLSDTITTKLLVALGKLKELAEPTTLAIKNLWDNGLSLLAGFTGEVLFAFYDKFLVPLGTWALGEGIPNLINAFNDFLVNIDWDTIIQNLSDFFEAISPYSISFGRGLVKFFQDFSVLSYEAINKILGEDGILEKLTETLNNNDPKKAEDWGYSLGVIITAIAGISAIGNVISFIINIITAVGKLIGFFGTLFTFFKDIAKFIFTDLVTSFGTLISVIKYVLMLDPFMLVVTLEQLYATNEAVRDFADKVNKYLVEDNPITKFINDGLGALADFVGKIPEYMKKITEMFIFGNIDLLNGLLNAIETIINTISKGINLVIKGVNAISGSSIKMIPMVEYGTIPYPKLAKGGIVDSGQIFMAGENGKEAIMPLENNTEWIQSLAMQISEFGGSGTDEVKIKRAFKEAIRESDFGDTVIQVDSEELARANNRGNKMLNRRYKVVLA